MKQLFAGLFVAIFLTATTVNGEVNAYEESDTLFMLTFQTPVGSFKPDDTVDGWGINGVVGTYFHPDGTEAFITNDTNTATNPFCFVGLPLRLGGGFNFYPTKSEWGSTGPFTLEIWAAVRRNIGYLYFEQMVFGFPKYGTSGTSVQVLSRYSSAVTLTLTGYTVPASETLQYTAISYNGTNYNVYLNGVNVAQPLIQKNLVNDIAAPQVTIGGKTTSGFASQNFDGILYMVKYSGTAKSDAYIAANWKAYQDERQPQMTFTGRSQNECANLCLNGAYGFGGRKKCRGYIYKPETSECLLHTFVCDMTGVISSPI